MADRIRPFRALRYDFDKVESARVVAPPYDVIDPAYAESLHERDPHNVVRLVLGKGATTDSGSHNRYTRARDLMAQWRQNGVLVREDRPALFAYDQTFEIAGSTFTRRGLVCAVRLEDFATGRILPHEITLSGPKQDRMRLLEATRCILSPIFAIYPDPDGRIVRLVRETAAEEPLIQVTDDGGVHNVLRRIRDEAAVRALAEAIEPVTLLIADGHHRYETALEYHQRHRTSAADDVKPHAYTMITLVSMADSGLVVLPTHRVVAGLAAFDPPDFAGRLAQCFRVREIDDDTPDLSRLAEAVAARSTQPTYGIYMGRRHKCLLATLADDRAARERARVNGRSVAWNTLDVSVLHNLILEDMLDIHVDGLSKDARISYEHEPEVARAKVDGGHAEVAFILNPTPVDAVRTIAEAGERMPPKSTFFYPKLLTGLVFFPHDGW